MSYETKLTSADTLAAAGHERAARAAPRAVLVVYGLDATTRVIEVPDGAQLTFGRSRNATVHVESERVSRIHARVTRRGDVLAVEDAGSRNGTWVNGAAITGAHVLASGDEIVVGRRRSSSASRRGSTTGRASTRSPGSRSGSRRSSIAASGTTARSGC